MRQSFVLSVVALLAIGCSTGPAVGSGDTIVDQDTSPAAAAEDAAPEAPVDSSAAPESDLTEGGVGTRENPAPIGATARIGDWEVTVVDVNLDASAAVKNENQFNDPPAAGRSFVLWTVSATYVGTESGTAWADLSWKLVGSAGNSFGGGMDDSCGVIPNDLFNQGEAFPGASVTGNVCVSAETDQLVGGTIMMEALFGDDRTFFALP